ncbi:MAG: hypothetical protein WBG70_24045 [Spirulinaceae cyanobacterium]
MSFKYFAIPVSLILATTVTAPAFAGPFDILRDVTDIINVTKSTIREAEVIGESLGINLDNVDTSEVESGSELAVVVYKEWSTTLPAGDQEIVQSLLLEYAGGQLPGFEEMVASPWYQGLDKSQQPRVIGLLAKFNQILELVDDKNVFLAGVFL